jgi:HEAT repeat protein
MIRSGPPGVVQFTAKVDEPGKGPYNQGGASTMNGIILLASALFVLAWGHPSPAREAAQDEEAARLRAQLIQARLENLALKLKLDRLAQKPAEEMHHLLEALGSDLPELSAAGFRELGALPEVRRREALPAVLAQFAAGSEAFRAQAVSFLGRVPAVEAEAAVLQAARDPSPVLRRSAASALKSQAGARAQAALLALLRDVDREVRLTALEALGVSKYDAAVRPILDALSTEREPTVQEKMVDALGAIGSPAAVDDLLELLGRTKRDTIRWSCINSLGKIGDARAAERVRSHLDDSLPIEVRQVSIEALGKLKDATSLGRVSEILRSDREEKLRQAAAAALGLMAPPEAVELTLLPAYLSDPSPGVRGAVWAAILSLTGDRFAPNEKLALALLRSGRRTEADHVCARLHDSKPDGETRSRSAALEEVVGAAALQAGDFKGALPHWRRLFAIAPERVEIARQIAACYRGLDDLDSCLKTLSDLKDPEPLIEEAHALLQSGAAEDRRKTIEQALRTGALRLVEPLAGKDDGAKKTAQEAIRRQGRRILGSLAAEVEENPKPPAAVLEAGSAITGIPNDPGANGNGHKARAAAWRAWLEKK